MSIAAVAVDTRLVAPGNWASTLATLAPFALCAMAQAPAVVSGGGGVDLSVGPTAGLVNVVIVHELSGHGVTSPLAVVPAALAIGLCVGAVNGLLIAYIRVPPIVTTLGSYLVLSGLTVYILPSGGGSAPGWLAGLAGEVYGIPGDLFLFIGIALVWTPLMHTSFRRNLYAVGSDERAAFAAGVNVARVRLVAYALTGVLAAVAGLAFTAVLASGDPTVGPPYTLLSLAGVALGGVALAGGRGGLIGAAAGGIVLYLIQNFLTVAGVQTFYSQVAYGGMLILALGVNGYMDARQRQRFEQSEKAADFRMSRGSDVRAATDADARNIVPATVEQKSDDPAALGETTA